MKLRSLSVTNFRAVKSATIEFGPGLNVLYGPNELGKSTLVEAIRAALLLPINSSEAKSLVPWGTDDVPQVVLEFELPDDSADAVDGAEVVAAESDSVDEPNRSESNIRSDVPSSVALSEATRSTASGSAPVAVVKTAAALAPAVRGRKTGKTRLFALDDDAAADTCETTKKTEAVDGTNGNGTNGTAGTNDVAANPLKSSPVSCDSIATNPQPPAGRAAGQTVSPSPIASPSIPSSSVPFVPVVPIPSVPSSAAPSPASSSRYRITKCFSATTRGMTLLEKLPTSGNSVEIAKGRDAEGKLRELLGWGLGIPGGKSSPRGYASSYLTTALLGQQDRETDIFEADLNADGLKTGRDRITEVLGALGEEPVVTKLMQRLELDCSKAFTKTGKFKTESPVAQLTQQCRIKQDAIHDLELQIQQSSAVEEEIRSLAHYQEVETAELVLLRRKCELATAALEARTYFEQASERHQALKIAADHQQAASEKFCDLSMQYQQAEKQRAKFAEASQLALTHYKELLAKRQELGKTLDAQREARQSQLQAQRADAERQRDQATRALRAQQAIDGATHELKRLAEQLVAARQQLKRAKQLSVLQQLREQEQTLQSIEQERSAAQLDVERIVEQGRVARREADEAEQQWLAARENATRVTEQLNQAQASAESERQARAAELNAQIAQVDLRLQQLQSLMSAEQAVVELRNEQTQLDAQHAIAQQVLSEAEHALRYAHQLAERERVVTLLAERDEARQQLDVAQASATSAREQHEQHERDHEALKSALESAKQAVDNAKFEQRQRQVRREELLSRQMQQQSAIARSQDELRELQSVGDASVARTKAAIAKAQLDSDSSQVDREMQQVEATSTALSQRVTQWQVAMLAGGVGTLLGAMLAIGLASGMWISASFALVSVAAAAVSGLKWQAERQQLQNSERQREQLKERRQHLASKLLISENALETAQRDYDQLARRWAGRFDNLELAETELQQRLDEQQREIESLRGELQALDQLAPIEVAIDDVERITQQLKNSEQQLREARSQWDVAQQAVFRVEVQVRTTEDRAAGHDLASIDSQLEECRQALNAVSKNAEPQLQRETEAQTTVAAARERLQALDHQRAMTAQRLEDAERRVTEQSVGCDSIATLNRPSNAPPPLGDVQDCDNQPKSGLQLKAAQQLRSQLLQSLNSLDATESESIAAATRSVKTSREEEVRTDALRQTAKANLQSLLEAHQQASQTLESIKRRDAAALAGALRRDDPSLVDTDVNDVVALVFRSVDSTTTADGVSADNASHPAARVDLKTIDNALRSWNAAAEKQCSIQEATAVLDQLTSAEARWNESLRQHQRDLSQCSIVGSIPEAITAAQEVIARCDAEQQQLDETLKTSLEQAQSTLKTAEQADREAKVLFDRADAEWKQLTKQKQIADGHNQAAHTEWTRRQTEADRFDLDSAQKKRIATEAAYRAEFGPRPDPIEPATEAASPETVAVNDVAADPVITPTELAELQQKVVRLADRVSNVEKSLDQARGKLTAAGGAVLRDKLENAQAELERLQRQSEQEEQKYEALKYLRDTLKVSQEKHALHLGHSLARPVGELFMQLTGTRFSAVNLDANLRLSGVVSQELARDADWLSVGARHQLAALIRLSLAAYLKTAIVLDDQLVHSDPTRLEWFQQLLRDSVRNHQHQIVIITCRPQDYIDFRALQQPDIQASDSTLRAVNLVDALQRTISAE